MPTSLFGGFSDPAYITTDPDKDRTDTYVKSEPIPSRYLGQNFKVPRGHKGRTVDCYFGGKFLTLASREQNGGKDIDTYLDPGRAERRRAIEEKKKHDEEKKKRGEEVKDFKYVSFPKKSTGPGSVEGTFITKYWEHMPEYRVVARDEKPERPKPQPRSITTRPCKKGTYGTPGTTLMKLPLEPMLDKEKKPITDVYDSVRVQERAAWEANKKKCLGGAFKLSGVGRTTFDEIGSVGVSAVYKQEPIKEEDDEKKKKKKKKGKGKGKAGSEEPKVVSEKPFRFSSPAKSGLQGFLGRYPNTRDDPKVPKEDPYDTVRLKRMEERKALRKGDAKVDGKKPTALGLWKPVSGPKSSVVCSLLRRFY